VGDKLLVHSILVPTIARAHLFFGLLNCGLLSWLNWITVVLCISCFDDSVLPAGFLKLGNIDVGAVSTLAGGMPGVTARACH
jgi:hypothetical protein